MGAVTLQVCAKSARSNKCVGALETVVPCVVLEPFANWACVGNHNKALEEERRLAAVMLLAEAVEF
jgi:hypothetical protein